MHLCTLKQSTHSRKIRTVLHIFQILHQRIAQQQWKEKHSKASLPQCTPCTPEQSAHCRKTRTARLPIPAPARSAVKRTGSVTTEHQAAPCSTKLHSKIETRLLQVCTQKPSFSSPPCTALFFFSAHGEKEEGGASPTKELHSKKKQKPPFQTGPLPSAPPRQRRRAPRPGAKPLPAPKAAEPEKPPSHWKIPHHFHGKAKKFTIPPLQCPGLRYNKAILLMHVLQGRVQVPTGGKAREPKGMIR